MTDVLVAWIECEHTNHKVCAIGGRRVTFTPSHDFDPWGETDLCRICEDYEPEHKTVYTLTEEKR